MIRVLMVCAGNICRSPMAEAVFRHEVMRAGLAQHIEIDSAGTGAWHTGERAHPGTLRVLEREGIVHQGRARQLQKRDLDEFDYILAMDTENLSHVRRLGQGQRAQVGLFLDEAVAQSLTQQDEVPDPYYDDTFDCVYDLINLGTGALLARIRREHGV